MSATIFNSVQITEKILGKLKTEVKKLNFRPLFCDILVGNDPVSLSYVKIKGKKAIEIGLDFKLVQLSKSISTQELILEIKEIEKEPNLSGLIIQLPLPDSIDQQKVLSIINPEIDADCLSGKAKLVSPTAGAIITILGSLNLDLASKNILVIGQGELVGKPVTKMLEEKGLKITVADRSTDNLLTLTQNADVIISGAGSPRLINGKMIKQGSILIDAGTADLTEGIVGDIDTRSVIFKAGFLSPTPGGVGPVTVAKLLENVVKLAKMRKPKRIQKPN